MMFENYCRTPTLAKCEGEAQHLEKSGVGVATLALGSRPRQKGLQGCGPKEA
jgi:hypothetical protein